MGLDGGALPLPKRVVDVFPPGSARGELRLHETLDNERWSYICLSHCWGSIQPFQTTRRTLAARKRDILWDKLPQMFQDAVFVTRGLGRRFLWIDSLCIVQDDCQDYENQAPLMCGIYHNASLTLAATRCRDCTDTLFPSFGRTVEGVDETGALTTLSSRIKCRHFNGVATHPPRYPLLKRGCVFQEESCILGITSYIRNA